MVCGNCVMHVKNALMDVSGVTNVDVSLEKKTAEVTLGVKVSDVILSDAVKEAGYEVKKYSDSCLSIKIGIFQVSMKHFLLYVRRNYK